MTATAGRARASALLRASHPLPTVGVTAFTTALGVGAGNSVGRCVLIAAAIFAGQLTIGWSNDRHDVDADRQVGRSEKPLAMGEVALPVVDAAIGVAVLATIGLSLALGWRAGLVHLGAVASGWLYNVWLKGTWLSWLPYAVAFGALPAVATLARSDHPAPAAWALLAGAFLGVAANFTNALPDLDNDRVTGFRGAPNRVGARGSLLIGAALLIGATAGIAVGPPGPVRWFGWAGVTAVAALVVVAVPLLWRRAQTRAPFYALMSALPIDIVMMLLGRHLY
jgi:4-hydroxybenzoate polyprenyltransferase